MKATPRDYRSLLKQELETRLQGNPRYSLRAFARDLCLSSARLSEVLNGKCGMSRERAMKVARALGMNALEQEAFADQVESLHGRSKLKRELARVRLGKRADPPEYQQLQMDTFRVISDWYHFAILELLSLRDFVAKPAWIARALAISELEASQALERLERLEMIVREGSKIRAKEAFTASPDGIPSESIRKFHRQVLRKAEGALQVQGVDQRDFSATLMAFDPARMPEAKARIKAFRREFNQAMSPSDSKSAVYCFSKQFFEVTQKQRRES